MKQKLNIDTDKFRVYQNKKTKLFYLVEDQEFWRKREIFPIKFECHPTTISMEDDTEIIRLTENGDTIEINEIELKRIVIDCKLT